MNKDYDGRFKRRTFSPWKRGRDESKGSCIVNIPSLTGKFESLVYANMDVSVDAKRATLKVAASVVSLVSFTCGKPFFWGSGIIIDSEDINGIYTSTILTSASLFGCPTKSDYVPGDIEIHVYLSNGILKVGQTYMINAHYNIAAIKIESDVPLPIATLKFLDDSISVNPNESSSSRVREMDLKRFKLRSHSDTFSLCPGEKVVAVGRYHKEPYDIMSAPGIFSLDVCKLDCTELFKADCLITKCGIGGPLINRFGEVIGINFYDLSYTPFLPINIACRCLEYFKEHGSPCQPWLGMAMTNLYAASVGKLEKIIQNFPNIHKGVIVEEVFPSSPAFRAEIFSEDVIVECDGSPVRSFLEFWGMVSNKAGKSMELIVIREGKELQIILDVGAPNKSNRWPVPDSFELPVDRVR